jgi:UDP-N-acetylmuramoyl-tripeptide--D-alanyl-D-alanine ligase
MNSVSAAPYVEMELTADNAVPFSIKSHLYGGYNAANILAAACIGQHLGVDVNEIVRAAESYEPSNNRSQIIKTSSNLLIMDAYNANPSSMEAAISTFALTGYENKVVILGDMRELGEETDSEHLRLIEFVAEQKFSLVFLVGPEFTRLNTRRENLCFGDSDLAAMWFEHHRPEGCTILIKGSRGIRLEKVVEKL